MNFVNKMVDYSENLMNRVLRLVPSASGKVLYNKWVLYFIFVVSLVDLSRFYMVGNTNAVLLFFAIGLLTTFFSKNMTVVLVVALALTHLAFFGTGALEGMEQQEEVEEEEDVEEEDVVEEEEEKKPEIKKDESFESIAETAKTVSLLSKDAKDLPTQTVELLNKQKELMANMTQLQPLLKKAENLIKSEGFETISQSRSHYAEYK